MSQISPARFGRPSNRRDFVKAASLAIGAPWILPSSVFAAAPSNRINAAVIGNGNQSTLDLPAFLRQDDVQVVAACDVNTASHGYKTPKQFLGRKPAQAKVEHYYAEKTASGRYSGCKAYVDFRDVLARATSTSWRSSSPIIGTP